MKHPQKPLQYLCYVLQSTGTPLAARRKEQLLPKQKKQGSVISLAQTVLRAVSPEMLQHADASLRQNLCITTEYLVLSLSKSKESVNHITRDHGYSKVCALEGFLKASQSNIKLTEQPFILSCLHTLKQRDSPSYLGLLQHMKPGSIILNWSQKRKP
jgi:hypothetical protein